MWIEGFEGFKAFEDKGRALVDLHVNDEQVGPYAEGTASCLEAGADATDLQATKLKHGKIASHKGNAIICHARQDQVHLQRPVHHQRHSA